MIGAISPYAVIVLIALLIIALAVVWLCRNAMRAGSIFEGEIGNRWLSMKIRTKPPPLSSEGASDKTCVAVAAGIVSPALGGPGGASEPDHRGETPGEIAFPDTTYVRRKPHD